MQTPPARRVSAEEMARLPHGATRVVPAGSKLTLPSRGFMTVAGVLPSREISLVVHAYEQNAGAEIERRARESGALSGAVGDDDEGSEEEASASASASAEASSSASAPGGSSVRVRVPMLGGVSLGAAAAASGGEGVGEGGPPALPDWVEVRVEGVKATPPTPVWLARRVNVKVTASETPGVARRVVVRAGEQTLSLIHI